MLSYLVNTLIFILVGLVIAHRAFSQVESIDWVYLVVLYFGSTVIRWAKMSTWDGMVWRSGETFTEYRVIVF